MASSLNQTLFLSINQSAGQNPSFDIIIASFAEYAPVFYALVILWLWFSAKNNDEQRHAAFYAGYSAVLGLSINLLITLFYVHPRPFMDHLGIQLIPHPSESSFPSDHTTLMVSMALSLMFSKITRKLGGVLVCLGLVGGLSRVYCGLHYPFDIVGSVFVSLLASFIVYQFRGFLSILNQRIFKHYDALFS